MDRAAGASCKDYNRPDFHPDDSDTTELVETWRAELFGEHGTLNDKLMRGGGVTAATSTGVCGEGLRRQGRGQEHLDVLVVGAGLSGVGAGALPPDASAPGPATPSSRRATPSAAPGTSSATRASARTRTCTRSGYSFRPWDGEKSIADGASILQYIKDTAAETGVDKHIRFDHRVLAADWSSAEACWQVTARAHRHRRDGRADGRLRLLLHAATTATTTATCPSSPAWSASPGTIVHPQAWPEDLDYTGKRVVVIGSGATAVTLIPALAAVGRHVTMLQRSPTYVVSLPDKSPSAGLLRKVLPAQAGRRRPRGSTRC